MPRLESRTDPDSAGFRANRDAMLLQYWGGQGYCGSRPWRARSATAACCRFGAGADEVMLGIICKYEGTLPAAPRS